MTTTTAEHPPTPADDLPTSATHWITENASGARTYHQGQQAITGDLAPTAAHILYRDAHGTHWDAGPRPHGQADTIEVTEPEPRPALMDATAAEQAKGFMVAYFLWRIITRAGGPRPTAATHTHQAAAFDPEWLEWLPSRHNIPDHQAVTLAGEHRFTHPEDREAFAAAYRARPQTWLFERVNHVIPWLNWTTAHLTELSENPLEVLAAIFDSRSTEQAPHAHYDQWYTVVMQIDGAKRWTIGTGNESQHLTTHPGDVLLLPEGLIHRAETPADPGHSRHLAFGMCQHTLHRHTEPALHHDPAPQTSPAPPTPSGTGHPAPLI